MNYREYVIAAYAVALHGKAYYTLGYYPVLFSFGAWWWEARLAGLRWPRVAAVLRPALVALPLLLLAPLLPFIYPVRPPAAMLGLRARYASLGLYTWEDGREHPLPQDYADMRGWRELADKTWAAYQSLPAAVRAHTLIKCANYGQASAINYYNRHRALPPAQSFNGSFLYWFPVRTDWQAVLIIDDELHPELAAYFASYREVGAVTDSSAREHGTRIILGRGPEAALTARVNGEWRDELAQWEKNKK